MATLETQYKNFLKDNPDTTFSFNEWMSWHRIQIEQALIQMMQDDEDLGLYDEPKQNWYHDGKIIDGKQERMYSEEEVLDIAKQAFVLGKDFGLIGTFNEWFETVKKK
jgi:hypothetical protein